MISKIGRDLEGHSQNNLMLFTNLFKFLWISPKLKSWTQKVGWFFFQQENDKFSALSLRTVLVSVMNN